MTLMDGLVPLHTHTGTMALLYVIYSLTMSVIFVLSFACVG